MGNTGGSPRLARWLYRWGPVLIAMAVLFWLSSRPDEPGEAAIDGIVLGDKVLHAAAYAVLGALIWRGLSRTSPRWWQIGATVAIAAAYGLTDESHQIVVPGRDFDIADLAADAAGALIAATALSIRFGGDAIGRQRGTGEDLRSEGQAAREP